LACPAQADHVHLQQHGVADHVLGQGAQFAQRQGDVVEHGQRRIQRALLEQHAPVVAHALQLLRAGAR
jgi:hypothetical protein